MTNVFDAIADPIRREVVDQLRSNEEMSVGQLVETLGLSQPTVSKHLKVLRESGLVTVREVGQHRIYRLVTTGFREILGWIGSTDSAEIAVVEPFLNLRKVGFSIGLLLRALQMWRRATGRKVGP
tara:strand:- start:727 stop:1101 length:375 start_codon:yes stop_codon:yes gene_type:complete